MTHEGLPRKVLKQYEHSPELLARLYRRTLLIVALSQIFGGAGLAAGVTVGALLAQDMLGSENLAGVPVALLTLGSAGSAWLVGRISGRLGRRAGLTAGTDLAGPKQRAKAVSVAMVSTTVGAVAGPNLVGTTGRLAESIGVPALAGPFLLGAAAFLLAGLTLFVFLRPDPYMTAKAIGGFPNGLKETPGSASVSHAPAAPKRGAAIASAVMIVTQIVMVAIMTMTPVHMQHHGHGLNEVGLVISIHIAAMYLPSLVTGFLADRLGRTFMSGAACFFLLAAGIVAAVSPGDSLGMLVVALTLLGLGWNFGLISGTALLVDATDPATRARTQGTVDVLVSLAGASGGALSGSVVANSSYAALSFAGGILALMLLPAVFGLRSRTNPAATKRTPSA
ncbi:MFS transporter [Paenibacillus thailandensis]|uniref:MFS transporter n=1 Tax=Paenibacillus thailandensis TaxID=393250 RepID=A0ABW5QV64_9BACL